MMHGPINTRLILLLCHVYHESVSRSSFCSKSTVVQYENVLETLGRGISMGAVTKWYYKSVIYNSV